MALYVHFCADLKSPKFQIVSSFSNCRCGFQTKMIYAALFYLHGESIAISSLS